MKKWSGLESGEKSAQIKQCLQASQNSSNKYVGVFLMWETTGDGLFHWRKHYYGLWIQEVKTFWWICFLQTQAFLLHKMLIDGLKWCGLHCDVFISCLDSHSNGTHSLQRIHWSAMECDNSPNLMKKKTQLRLVRPEGEYIFSTFSFLCELFL